MERRNVFVIQLCNVSVGINAVELADNQSFFASDYQVSFEDSQKPLDMITSALKNNLAFDVGKHLHATISHIFTNIFLFFLYCDATA